MIRRIDRYVLREVVPPFLGAAIVVVVMFQINFYMAIGRQFDLRNIPQAAIFKLILLQTPGFINLGLPISVSLATSLALSRMARESELVALRGSGLRIARIVLPAALFGLMVGMLNFYVVDRVAPSANREAYKLQIQLGVLGTVTSFKTDVPLRIRNSVVSLGQIDRQPDNSIQIQRIKLIERPEPNKVTLTLAPNGRYRDGVWELSNARTWQISTQDANLDYAVSKKMLLNEKQIIQDLAMPAAPKEMSLSEIKSKIAEQRSTGMDTRQLEVEYHIKYSVPAMCLIFAFVSPIFAILFARSGGFVGVLISIVVVVVYWSIWTTSTQSLAQNPRITPFMAAWIPNLVFFALGAFGLKRLE